MKDIKLKEGSREPKIKSSAARMPKQLMRAAVLGAKERSHRISHAEDMGQRQASPAEYGAEKVASAEEWLAGESIYSISGGGRKLAGKAAERIREKKQIQYMGSPAHGTGQPVQMPPGIQQPGTQPVTLTQNLSIPQRGQTVPGRTVIPKRAVLSAGSGMQRGQTAPWGSVALKRPAIRTKPNLQKGQAVRTGTAIPKSPARKSGSVLQKGAAIQKSRAAQHLARKRAVKNMQSAQSAVRTSGRTAKGAKALVNAAAAAVRSLGAVLAASGGTAVALLIVMVGVVGGAAAYGGSQNTEPLSQEVLSYTSAIQRYASEYGIPEYVPVIQAIMMQESGGRGTDPMQSSECPYNTQFPNSPGAITDPEYSIQVGVQYYADCVREAGCESPQDMERLKLSLQGYNYGNGYISWALRNYGGYSEANALQFSQEQAAAHGWARYGDPEYVSHVLRYYSGGNPFAGLFGNDQIVAVAKEQLGNAGGDKFWSWYGFSSRVEWCACFVSWCANECGYIESGAVLKFSYCQTGADWFRSQNRWREAGYTPSPGDIIFFDWEGDGHTDHVGIVEKCENGIVYTIEGNSGDVCRQQRYAIGSGNIYGYGIYAQ